MLMPATVKRMAGERSNKMSKEDTMRLKATKRGISLLVGAFLALALAACGGGDSGALNDARDKLDAANARIGSADDPASLLGMLAAANARIGSADDPDQP